MNSKMRKMNLFKSKWMAQNTMSEKNLVQRITEEKVKISFFFLFEIQFISHHQGSI